MAELVPVKSSSPSSASATPPSRELMLAQATVSHLRDSLRKLGFDPNDLQAGASNPEASALRGQLKTAAAALDALRPRTVQTVREDIADLSRRREALGVPKNQHRPSWGDDAAVKAIKSDLAALQSELTRLQPQSGASALSPAAQSAPTSASGRLDFGRTLNAQLQRTDLPESKKADVRADLANLDAVIAGQAMLPTATEAIVQQATQGLSAEEVTIIRAKAFELTKEGLSADQTNPARFSANLAFEISEYVGMGFYSDPLLQRATELHRAGTSVFAAKPEMEQALTGNLLRGIENAGLRAEGKPLKF